MLIDLKYLVDKYKLHITGVLHVGAHTAEEAPLYHSLGITDVWWIEANPDLIPTIETNVARFTHHVINALVTNVEGEETRFNVTNNLQSSSVLELGSHRQSAPDVHYVAQQQLQSRTLDTLIPEHGITGANFWNFDIQGAELMALEGAAEQLEMADYVYLEVNRANVYIDNARIEQLDQFLKGFRRVETEWSGYGQGEWGDGFWIRIGL